MNAKKPTERPMHRPRVSCELEDSAGETGAVRSGLAGAPLGSRGSPILAIREPTVCRHLFEQRLPTFHRDRFVKLALEGAPRVLFHAPARGRVSCELEDGAGETGAVSLGDPAAAPVMCGQPGNLAVSGPDEDRRASSGGDPIEFARNDQSFERGPQRDEMDISG